jgi:hypothetical protein
VFEGYLCGVFLIFILWIRLVHLLSIIEDFATFLAHFSQHAGFAPQLASFALTGLFAV